jgi:hypothetical protein
MSPTIDSTGISEGSCAHSKTKLVWVPTSMVAAIVTISIAGVPCSYYFSLLLLMSTSLKLRRAKGEGLAESHRRKLGLTNQLYPGSLRLDYLLPRVTSSCCALIGSFVLALSKTGNCLIDPI